MADTILVVEDDDALRHAIVRNLTARGYAVRGVTSVHEAEGFLEETLPAMVLLDIELPDGSGWDVLRALPEDDRLRVPVVVMSAFRANPRLTQELHCRAVLEKPFPVETLLRIVADELSVHRPPETESRKGVDDLA